MTQIFLVMQYSFLCYTPREYRGYMTKQRHKGESLCRSWYQFY